MNIYYALWSDAINYERIRNGGSGHWKVFTFCYMSILLSLNLIACFSAILFFTGYNLALEIKQYLMFFQSELLTNALWAIVALFMPSTVVTYFFVFHNKKYEYILSKYKFRNGRLLLIYFLLTVISMFGFSLLNK
jgi:hypothetical protein